MTHDGRFGKILTFILVTALLLGLYLWAFFSQPESLTVWLTLSGLVLTVYLSLIAGRAAGLTAGLLLGLASAWRLFFPELTPWPLSLQLLLVWRELPALFFWLMHPVIALAAAQSAGILFRANQKLILQNGHLVKSNKTLTEQVSKQEDSLRSLSQKRLYRQSLWQQYAPDNDQEPIIGILITSSFDKIRSSQRRRLLDPRTAVSAVEEQPFFHLLLQAQPELVAILDLTGAILALNPCLMAVFGYPAGTQAAGRPFADFLLVGDRPAAIANIGKAVHNELDSSRTYAIRSAGGAFHTLAISPLVTLECTGDPLVIVVRSHTDPSSAPDDPARPDIADLVHGPAWCLSDKGMTLCVSRQVAEALGETSQAMIGKAAERYISRKQLADFRAFISSLGTGGPASIDLIMQPHGDRHTIFRLSGWPAIGENDCLVGVTLLAEDITRLKEVEDVLQHRLKMEQLISEISKQFVSVRADEMDSAIKEVLSRIGESEGAVETSIEIFRSRSIRFPARYHVQHSQTSDSSAASANQDQYEAVSVPIMIGEERLGYFHFSVRKYQSGWLDNDLPLIRLIGEIVINALIRKEHEQRILINEKRLSTTLQSIGEAVIATDTSGLVINMNRSAEKLTGWTFDEASQKMLSVVMHTNRPIQELKPPDPDTTAETIIGQDGVQLWSRDGKDYFIAATCSSIEDHSGAVYGDVIVFRDITKEKQEADEIRYISYHDSLTGLYNRTFFEEELKRLNTKRQYPITLILGDCNGLKIANDIFGHLEGDRLLIAIAEILKKATRREDIVSRWGGDEFAIILPKTDETTASSVRERILDLCAEAEANPIRPSLALGSATNTDGSDNLEALLKLAEDRMYRHKLMEGKSARNAILQSIKKMLYEKSYETEAHAGRMIDIANTFGRTINLTIDELEELSLLAVLHDMGKIGIPDQILSKSGQLSDDEWEIMKKHPEKGYNIAKSTPELNGIAQLILHHHEHWDGSGYPDGLKEEKIPKLSRVLSIIDAYDVITHHRPYKSAQSQQDALEEISRCAGTQFDPDLVRSFVAVLKADLSDLQDSGAAPEDIVKPSEMAAVNLIKLGLAESKTPVAHSRSREIDPGISAKSD